MLQKGREIALLFGGFVGNSGGRRSTASSASLWGHQVREARVRERMWAERRWKLTHHDYKLLLLHELLQLCSRVRSSNQLQPQPHAFAAIHAPKIA